MGKKILIRVPEVTKDAIRRSVTGQMDEEILMTLLWQFDLSSVG